MKGWRPPHSPLRWPRLTATDDSARRRVACYTPRWPQELESLVPVTSRARVAPTQFGGALAPVQVGPLGYAASIEVVYRDLLEPAGSGVGERRLARAARPGQLERHHLSVPAPARRARTVSPTRINASAQTASCIVRGMVIALVTLAIIITIWLAVLAAITLHGNLGKLDQALAGVLVGALLASVLGLFLSFRPGFLEVLAVVAAVALASSIIRFVLIRDRFVLTPGEFDAQYLRIVESHRKQALDEELAGVEGLLEDLDRADGSAHQPSSHRSRAPWLLPRNRDKVWRELVARQQATIQVLREDITAELRDPGSLRRKYDGL